VPDHPDEADPADTGDGETFADVPDQATCPSDPDFTDPLYCQPDTTDPAFAQITAEPGADRSDLQTPLIAGDPTLATDPAPPPVLGSSDDCSSLHPAIGGKTPSGISGRYGLSDANGYDSERTFDDPNAAKLGVMRVRLNVAWNLIPKAQAHPQPTNHFCMRYKNVYNWIAYVKSLGMEPLISFNYSETSNGHTHEPGASEYVPAVRAFINQFPYVHLFTAFNEPNLQGNAVSGSPLANDP
jgi:hypothetical protein